MSDIPSAEQIIAEVSAPLETNGVSLSLRQLTRASNKAEDLEARIAGNMAPNDMPLENRYLAIDERVRGEYSRLNRQYYATVNKEIGVQRGDKKKVTVLTAAEMKAQHKVSMRASAQLEGQSVSQEYLDTIDNATWPRGWPIDWRVLTMMEIAEYQISVEGDVWEAVCARMDIGLKELRIEVTGENKSTSKTVYNTIRDVFDRVRMEEVLESNWLTLSIYGNAFPITIWEGKEPLSVFNINPKYMSVGLFTYGRNMYEILPDRAEFDESALQAKNPDLFVNSLAPWWNQFWIRGRGLLMRPDSIQHLHVKKLDFERYALPPLARAFRAITTRAVLDEMIRGTIEGVKNQFWTFFLTNPRMGEIPQFKAALETAASQRTGSLVWPQTERDGVQVQQHLPGKIDELLAVETWARLTQQIFRQLGVSVRLISGETPGFVGAPGGGGSGGSGGEIDIEVLTERLEYDRKIQVRFMLQFLKSYAERKGDARLANELSQNRVKIYFDPTVMERTKNVKDVIAPMSAFGMLPRQTIFRMMGLDYTTQRQLRVEENESGDDKVFLPYVQFKQGVVGQDGKETSNTGESFGRTSDAENPKPKKDSQKKAPVIATTVPEPQKDDTPEILGEAP